MDYQDGYSELVRKCGFQYEEAYAIATKKLAECCQDEDVDRCEDIAYWKGIKGMLAEDIADRHMLAIGYGRKENRAMHLF